MMLRISSSKMFLLLTLVISCWVDRVAGAWQQISDYTDCGSTNFKTEKILVNLDDHTDWLNISILGQFNTQVVDADSTTNRASISSPLTQIGLPNADI